MNASALLLMLALFGVSCRNSHGPFADSSFGFETTPGSSMGDGEFRYGATIDGEITWWSVPFAKVLETADWSPGSDPPLSLAEAVRLAEAEMPKYTSTPGAFRLDKVEWLNVTDCGSSKKWIYLVSFERDQEYQGHRFNNRGTITIPVLLDGTVIQGHREKSSAREQASARIRLAS